MHHLMCKNSGVFFQILPPDYDGFSERKGWGVTLQYCCPVSFYYLFLSGFHQPYHFYCGDCRVKNDN